MTQEPADNLVEQPQVQADETASRSAGAIEAQPDVQGAEQLDQGLEGPAVDESSVQDDEELGVEEAPSAVEEVETTFESAVEAVLFASDEPLTPQRLLAIMETGSVRQIRECVANLNGKYRQGGHAFRIERIAGGYQMMTLGAFNSWLRKLVRVRTDSKLSPAALETLAIIAYKQPIIRADVEAIRGVASGEILRSLMYKGLVKIVGRAEVLGRPMLYGTTRRFLETFGLNSLDDLPRVEELKRPQS